MRVHFHSPAGVLYHPHRANLLPSPPRHSGHEVFPEDECRGRRWYDCEQPGCGRDPVLYGVLHHELAGDDGHCFVWKEEARISGIWNWFQALRNMMSALDITTG